MHEVIGGIRDTLRVGTTSSPGMIDLPAVPGQFHREYPEVSARPAIVGTERFSSDVGQVGRSSGPPTAESTG